MSLVQAAIAANRFGLGARNHDLKAISGDPRGWLKAQLRPETSLPAPLSVLPSTEDATTAFAKWLSSIGVGPGGEGRPDDDNLRVRDRLVVLVANASLDLTGGLGRERREGEGDEEP